MKRPFIVFLLRWVLNSLGLWIAVRIFGAGYDHVGTSGVVWEFLLAGLVFSIINSVLRPIAVILSLPAILLTLGLFVLVVNGLMVYISLLITPGISMTFMESILTGILLSLINYIVSATIELRQANKTRERL
jgi:putative membrane protein